MTDIPPDRTAWMAGRFGIMHHWLFPGGAGERFILVEPGRCR